MYKRQVKINYGALMAQYMSAWMGSYDMTPEEKQEYDAYMEELSNRMFLDVYMREIGGNCYMLVQIYSGDQAGNAALLLSQMQPYAGGGWSYTEICMRDSRLFWADERATIEYKCK